MTKNTVVLMADVTNLKNDSRLLRESSTLATAGYQVILLGYNRENQRFRKDVRPNGVVLWELPYARPKDRARLISLLLLVWRDVRFFIGLYGRILATTADVYHAHNLYILPIMWLSARLRRRPLVYDSHELFCEWRRHGPYSGLKQWVLNRFIDLEHILCRRADRVICVSAGIQKILSRVHKIPRPLVIENFPSKSEICVTPRSGKLRKKLGVPVDKKIVIFSGGFYKAIRLDNLVRIAPRFPDVAFALMGFDSLGYKDELMNLREQVKADNVVFVDPAPAAEVVDYVADADIAVHLYASKLLMLRYCSSNKIYQYLAAGLPIVCATTLQSVRKATEGYNVCYWVDPENLDDLEKAVREAVSLSPAESVEVGRQARLCVETKNCWEAQEESLVQLYRNVEERHRVGQFMYSRRPLS